jgi:hypothetical protein
VTFVAELIPGDLVEGLTGAATFVGQLPHPLYPGLQMVIWRMPDRSWSHDALSPAQFVGEALPANYIDRRQRLKAALGA